MNNNYIINISPLTGKIYVGKTNRAGTEFVGEKIEISEENFEQAISDYRAYTNMQKRNAAKEADRLFREQDKQDVYELKIDCRVYKHQGRFITGKEIKQYENVPPHYVVWLKKWGSEPDVEILDEKEIQLSPSPRDNDFFTTTPSEFQKLVNPDRYGARHFA